MPPTARLPWSIYIPPTDGLTQGELLSKGLDVAGQVVRFQKIGKPRPVRSTGWVEIRVKSEHGAVSRLLLHPGTKGLISGIVRIGRIASECHNDAVKGSASNAAT